MNTERDFSFNDHFKFCLDSLVRARTEFASFVYEGVEVIISKETDNETAWSVYREAIKNGLKVADCRR